MATCGNPTGAVDLIAGWCNAKTRNSAREVSPKVAHCSSAILHFVVLGGENHIHGRFLIFHRILKARMSQEKVKNATEDTLPRSGCGNGLVLERHLNKGLSKVHGNLSVEKHASPPKLSVSVCAQESCEEIQYHCWIRFIFSTKHRTNTCLIRMWHHCNSPPKNAVTQPPWHASDNRTWHPRHLNQLELSDAELEPTAWHRWRGTNGVTADPHPLCSRPYSVRRISFLVRKRVAQGDWRHPPNLTWKWNSYFDIPDWVYRITGPKQSLLTM